MNIWLSFVPGSAATSIEMILRSCTDLKCLPVFNTPFVEEGNIITSHAGKKQWHPNTRYELENPEYEDAEDNIFTPILPMPDFDGVDVLNHISECSGKKFYLGPSTEDSAEFAIMTTQKVPGGNINILPTRVKENNNLQRWEIREYISLELLQWWLAQMKEQWDRAKALGFECIDTYNIFAYYKNVVEDIIKHVGCNITNHELFDNMTKQWFNGQGIVWNDWHNYSKYKNGENATITENIIYEGMIQYHLRQQGIELKCYGLNDFPDSQTLKEYYE